MSKTKNTVTEADTQNFNAGEIINGDKAYISSAQIIQTKTGTGPWDSNDEPGNDSSEDNNIVRSFDQITYTVDLTMSLKKGITDTSLKGGVINVEVVLPENCANVMKWDLDSMRWLENGSISEDGRTLTGKYSMSNTEITIPGKQTLVFVLKVEGAGNRTEIEPSFKFGLEGNNENEKVSLLGNKTIVSAKGKYNIQLHRNSVLVSKSTVDYGESEKEGRMYGYTFAVQLYNENESKGLKGIEYPKGEISFDINLKLERSKFESEELEDITNECTPILWQYGVHDWDTDYGNIPNRKYLNYSSKYIYDLNRPLGKFKNANYSTYNSGDIKIEQEDSKLKIKVNNYQINGIFPYYNSAWHSAITERDRSKIYTENIGTFSIGYMQLFVPDNEASTIKDRNYYLTVSDNNINMTSITNEKITSQMKNSDDSQKVQHILYNPGSYAHDIYVFNQSGNLASTTYSGTMANPTVELDKEFTFPKCEYVAPNEKHFKGWQVDNTVYKVGDKRVFTKDDQNKEIKAVWEEHTFDQKLKEVNGVSTLKDKATCTTNAIYYKSCACGQVSTTETFEDKDTKLGHEYTKQIKDSKYLKSQGSHCQEHDVYWYACSRCDVSAKDDENAQDKYYESAEVGNHVFSKDWHKDSNNHWHSCTVPGCNEVSDKGNHVYNQEVESSEYLATPATCMTPARYYKSCICGAKGTEAFAATGSHLGHAYIEVKNPQFLREKATNCKEHDTYWYVCSRCGKTSKTINKYYEDKDSKGEHISSDWIIDQQPTVAKEGSKHKECTVCKEVLETEKIAKLENVKTETKKEETASKKEIKVESKKAVTTGDNTNSIVPMVLLGISLLGIYMIVMKKCVR